jgi:hypothetical protein
MSSSFTSLFENVVIDQGVDEDSILDIFEMTQTQMNQQKSMLTRNLLFFGVFK